jgi:hypothetical protein
MKMKGKRYSHHLFENLKIRITDYNISQIIGFSRVMNLYKKLFLKTLKKLKKINCISNFFSKILSTLINQIPIVGQLQNHE